MRNNTLALQLQPLVSVWMLGIFTHQSLVLLLVSWSSIKGNLDHWKSNRLGNRIGTQGMEMKIKPKEIEMKARQINGDSSSW